MKKNFIAALMVAVSTLFLFSCEQAEFEGNDDGGKDTATVGVLKVNASLVATKVSSGDDDNPVVWSDGDKLICEVDGNRFEYNLTEGAGEPDAVFEFAGEASSAPVPPFMLVLDNGNDGVPVEQDYLQDSFDGKAVYLSSQIDAYDDKTGVASGEFQNGFSVVNIKLTGDYAVSSLKLKSAETMISKENYIDVRIDEAIDLSGGVEKSVKVVVNPGVHELTVIAMTTDNKFVAKEYPRVEYYAGKSADLSIEITDPKKVSTPPYKEGDYYSDGEDVGVVILTGNDGMTAKIMSLTDVTTEPVQWSSIWEITGATNEDEGVENCSTVLSVAGSFDNYPAFKACAEYGEGWYLPSVMEVQAIRDILDLVNSTLQWSGGEVISEDSQYWSSTEVVEFADAMSFTASMKHPGMFGFDKNEKFPVRAFKNVGVPLEAKFAIGDLYDQNGLSGIVFWVSKNGQYAKIMSFDEKEALWGPVGVASGAADEYDGLANMSAISAVDPDFEDYPAFEACRSMGEDWYLPSVEELNAISRLYSVLNGKLGAAEKTLLSNTFYWSSTEYAMDNENSAKAVLAGGDDILNSSKNISRKVRAVAYVGDRPTEAKKYEIGEPYIVNDEVIGVVYEITDAEGYHGKMVAMRNVDLGSDYLRLEWQIENQSEIGAFDEDNGMNNMLKAIESDPMLLNMPAFAKCRELGKDWYLPAKNELEKIGTVLSIINPVLSENGGSRIWDPYYWSSTEVQGSPKKAYGMDQYGKISEDSKMFRNYVRPIRTF